MFTRKTRPLDCKSLTYEQLLATKSQLDAEIAARASEELDDLKRRLHMIADAQGVAVTELIGIKKERKERKGRQVKVRFRNPEDPTQTWSGLGKPKKWLQEKLDAGRTLDEFAI
jgi:DNA-binding protein H-NS